jgi:hypothetical protein
VRESTFVLKIAFAVSVFTPSGRFQDLEVGTTWFLTGSHLNRNGQRTGTVSVEPFFAKIIASSRAGSVWLALLETSCVAPGGS